MNLTTQHAKRHTRKMDAVTDGVSSRPAFIKTADTLGGRP